MAGPTLYCTLADVIALVSLDAQARLATDAGVQQPLADKGDGSQVTFNTPFQLATTITTLVGGALTANTLIPGGATNGNDQVTFATHPANNALITAAADAKAINISVVDACRLLASNRIKGSLAGYLPADDAPFPPEVQAVLQPLAVFFTRWYLRSRRGMNEYDPIIEEYKSADRWLLAVAKGQIALPSSAVVVTSARPLISPVYAEPSVFEAPGTNPPNYGPYSF
jgi:phage gp36-like protein